MNLKILKIDQKFLDCLESMKTESKRLADETAAVLTLTSAEDEADV